jgi:hypothetical protein
MLSKHGGLLNPAIRRVGVIDSHMNTMQVTGGIIVILIDTREQHQEYIRRYLDSNSIENTITCLGNGTGMDYFIANGNRSVGVQRKTADEVFQEMEEIRGEVIPSLMELTDTPVLLIEEQFNIGRDGHMYRKQGGFLVEVGLTARSYYNFLNSIRLMGCEVVCTRNLDQSIWWMISTHSYIADEHYPKRKKGFGHNMQAVGALCCVNNFGITSVKKLLSEYSLGELMVMDDAKLRGILNTNQHYNFCGVRDVKLTEADLKGKKRRKKEGD